MDYSEHKEYYRKAYQTGSDTWPHLPVEIEGVKLLERLPKGSLILDIGSGRGLFARHLANLGYRVIGIDFEGGIVKKANQDIAEWGLTGKMKFMEADVFDIPLTDGSFDGACDFGLLENLYPEDWERYAKEIARVLKPGGFYLNLSRSKETKEFFEFSPKASPSGSFEKYGMHYYFFDKEEMKNIFSGKFTVVSQDIFAVQKPRPMFLLETLFQKPK